MAQSPIIALTVDYAGTTPLGGVARGFDINNFASPVQVGTLGTVVRYVEGGAYSIKQNESSAVTNYIVQESLAAMALLGEGIVVLTVEKRGLSDTVNQEFLKPESMLFDVNKFFGPATPAGAKTGFYYRETGASDPIYYLVSESLSAIIAAVPVGPANAIVGITTAPYYPYSSGPSDLSDGFLRHDAFNNALKIVQGAAFTSFATGKAIFLFDGAAGDEVRISTDNSGYAESYLELTKTQARLFSADGSFESDVALANVSHGTEVRLITPLVGLTDTGKMDVSVLGGTYEMFDTNATIVGIGKSGGTLNVRSTLTMLAAKAQLAAGVAGYPSANITAGVAPAAPADGDIWSTATNNELVMRQNGVSTTMLSAKAVTTEVLVTDTSVTVVIGGVTYKLLARA